ncbi:membrane protein [Sulfuricaulis limicola]|uniref:Membrane protein n=1 Tax=Sulfuricaulis limicola TaxID=1620215 RepID=A0A1B4XDY9_9GAMM|nr:EamA family transporter [Sulfuricaulis limicola]BAV32998.1 membrane protein [Sulfuricaulis limicola]
MQIPWYVTALGAALVWGVHYPLVDHALKKLSLVSVLLLTALPIVVLGLFFHRTLAADYAVWTTLGTGTRARVLALALTSLLGSVLLFLSIAGKNATLASLIEISYPVFVALFAWLLFREIHINPSVIIGGLLVFAGVVMIVWNNP